MKSTGVVRQLDSLGRIVIPIELRRTMDIAVKDSLEIFVEGDQIVLKKYDPTCLFCGSAEGVRTFKDKHVCQACMQEIANT
ncbi:MAG: AbrB/MazE/SpoVT family DNA-binding domain-containing protein [Clostridia bacterium]|nr:AbrB/MazE/SpoVT family DNA-binding domain-containing protein [Clostridia bacterium]